jgi:hypothetical protein
MSTVYNGLSTAAELSKSRGCLYPQLENSRKTNTRTWSWQGGVSLDLPPRHTWTREERPGTDPQRSFLSKYRLEDIERTELNLGLRYHKGKMKIQIWWKEGLGQTWRGSIDMTIGFWYGSQAHLPDFPLRRPDITVSLCYLITCVLPFASSTIHFHPSSLPSSMPSVTSPSFPLPLL